MLEHFSDFNKEKVAVLMNEFAGIKIIEALEIVVCDLPKCEREEILERADQIIESLI